MRRKKKAPKKTRTGLAHPPMPSREIVLRQERQRTRERQERMGTRESRRRHISEHVQRFFSDAESALANMNIQQGN